jgi:hypothetical protein
VSFGQRVFTIWVVSGILLCEGISLMSRTYEDGWDDCLDAVLTILDRAKSFEEAKEKIKGVQVLVKSKRFEKIRSQLGVLFDLF